MGDRERELEERLLNERLARLDDKFQRVQEIVDGEKQLITQFINELRGRDDQRHREIMDMRRSHEGALQAIDAKFDRLTDKFDDLQQNLVATNRQLLVSLLLSAIAIIVAIFLARQ